MFLEYYGLREQPFGVTPNPRYLYHSPIHREALASLIYGIEADLGFAALIADPGMGKTTLLFYLLEKFRNTARTALIFQTLCTPGELLRYLASELEIQTKDTDTVSLNERIKDVLVQEAQAHRRVIVIIDEAQNLDEPVLETIRLLSDFETQNTKLLHIILAGQLQLAEKLARPGMAQLLQRVSMLNRLSALTSEETKNYIDYRLSVAGYRGRPLFSTEAINLIAEMSGGVPRKINRICFNALSLGCALGKRSIEPETVREVGNDLDIGDLLYKKGAITDQPKTESKPQAFSKPLQSERISAALHNAPEVASASTPAVVTQPSRQPVAGVTAVAPAIQASSPTLAPVSRPANPVPATNNLQPITTAKKEDQQGIGRPLSSALPKPVASSVPAPESKPILVKAQPSPGNINNNDARPGKPKAAVVTVTGILATVLALAAWTLWANNPRQKSDVVDAASTVSQSSGQDIDLPYSAPPKIDQVTDHGKSVVKTRTSGSDSQGDAEVSMRNFANSAPRHLADANRQITDLAPRTNSSSPQHVISTDLIKKVQPVYPAEARRSGIQGSVTVSAVIGTDGRPRRVRAINGNPLLARAAVDAVNQWQYQPYLVNGRAVEVETEVVVDFALR